MRAPVCFEHRHGGMSELYRLIEVVVCYYMLIVSTICMYLIY